jgi:4-amino-4-deoxy-L-arabinose transferase-like glycosyltransferase
LIAKIPLLDKTEARYAEIARIMWDTNKWIMPN